MSAEPPVRHNFYSDTQTRPGPGMLAAVLEAEVGDEQQFADPTTRRLEERSAALLGKEAAVFLPTGTMCNEIAIRAHTEPGDEVICERSSHIVVMEGGGPAALSGVMICALDGERGMFTAEAVRAAVRPVSRYMPRSRLVAVEQTANLAGGSVWPLEMLDEVAAAAREDGLVLHMDGARLLNAAVASGVSAARWARDMDSVWLDFTKGLGCPVGAVLAGSREFIERAWRWKQQWGGAMRQSGVLAAMGLYALEHNVERLADDHRRAARIGRALAEMRLVAAVAPVETNIAVADLSYPEITAPRLAADLRRSGASISVLGERRIRIVTHLDVDDEDVDALLDALTPALA